MQRTIILAMLLFALAPAARAAESVDAAPALTVRNNMHACPAGSIVTGVHVARNQLLCLGRFVDPRGNMTRNERVDQGARPDNQWPPDAVTRAAHAYTGPAMHWCGPNRYVTGVHVANNAFSCAELPAATNRNYTSRLGHLIVDSGSRPTQRSNMHACPAGTVLVGAHFATNTFLCAELAFCQDNSHCPSTADVCETNSVFCDPGETDCIFPTTGVCRQQRTLGLCEERHCRGDAVGGLTDRSGNIVDLTNNDSFENDEASSMRIQNIRPGAIVRVFDNSQGRTDDDWAQLLVMRSTSTWCIGTFESGIPGLGALRMQYHRDNGLNGKVSRVEVWSALIGAGEKCLDVNTSPAPNNNLAVQIFNCHGGPNQSWEYTVEGQVRGVNGLCLEARRDDIQRWQPGGPRQAAVRMAACDAAVPIHQRWSVTEAGELRMFGTMCLDIRGGGSADQTPVQLFPCHGGANQRWISSF